MAVKSFITLAPDGEVVFEVSRPVGKVIKLFLFVTDAPDNKLDRLRLESFLQFSESK
jgi:hypothetical protein